MAHQHASVTRGYAIARHELDGSRLNACTDSHRVVYTKYEVHLYECLNLPPYFFSIFYLYFLLLYSH